MILKNILYQQKHNIINAIGIHARKTVFKFYNNFKYHTTDEQYHEFILLKIHVYFNL